jgi:hypothetical protein
LVQWLTLSPWSLLMSYHTVCLTCKYFELIQNQ